MKMKTKDIIILTKENLKDFTFNPKAPFDEKTQQKLYVTRNKRITKESLVERGKESRKSIEGFRKGMLLTPEALNHTYTI